MEEVVVEVEVVVTELAWGETEWEGERQSGREKEITMEEEVVLTELAWGGD